MARKRAAAKEKPAEKTPEEEAEQLDPHRGFRFIGATFGKKPEDYFPNGEGFRPGEDRKPWGVAKTDIRHGLEGATIPPMSVWDQGKWAIDLSEESRKLFTTVSDREEWAAWCINGMGTPGNYAFRVYIIPDDIACNPEPLHPSLWGEKMSKGKAVTTFAPNRESAWSGGVYHSPGTQQHPWASQPKPATPPAAPKAPAMPTSIRIRCSGCGHWFKMDDLPKHAEWACPGINGEGDWAMMCDNACGCNTLSEVARVKDGFPRKPIAAGKKAVEETKPKEEVKENGNGDGKFAGDVRPAEVAAPAGD